MQQKAFELFSTDGCHLCEQAISMLAALGLEQRVDVVDIVDSPALVEEYGIRIPVIKNVSSAEELSWPFSNEQLYSFITN